MSAFVTGSQAYGTPLHNSDIDLVVMVSKEDHDLLVEAAKSVSWGAEESALHSKRSADALNGFTSIRFGELNLLCCCDPDVYATWLFGTEELKKRAPVLRSEAVKTFQGLQGRMKLLVRRDPWPEEEEEEETF